MSTHPSGVLDTNAIILLGALQPEHLPDTPLISAVSLARAVGRPVVSDDPNERAARQARLRDRVAFDPLPFDAASARAFGRVAASLRRAVRRVQPRAFDAMIAATAISNDVPVYTCNPRNLTGIDDLAVVPVPHPDSA